VHRGRWGFYPCSFEVFRALKELNRLWQRARHDAEVWRRWYRMLPHNRVRRPRLRDAAGRRIGYGPPVPVPEPALPTCFCRKVELPSGRFEVVLADEGVEAAYRLARYPKPTAEEVVPLPLAEEKIRAMHETYR
jgi:hypothetical protein